MSGPAVALRIEGEALWATINRPHARNAIDLQVIAGLEAALEAAAEAKAKVLVLRGSEGTFCAGADLGAIQALTDDPHGMRSFLERLGTALERLEDAPWVNLAVVEGYAVAGGCELLLACDIVLASADAKIGDRHVEYGLVPGGGSSVRLPRTIPASLARYLLLTGELISGTQAAEWGLATLAVPPEDLEQELRRVIDRLCSRGRATLRTVKAMLDEQHGTATTRALQRERDLFLEHLAAAPDAHIGLQAFRERVTPSFDAG